MSARAGRSSPAVDPQWLTVDEERAWVALAHVFVQLPGALDSQLQRDSGINLFEYLVLSRLSMAPDRRSRMSELAETTGGSLSRLSNVVKRLEQRGFVRREPDPDNGRYTRAVLTDPGWNQVVAAAPGHVAAVRHFVFESLDPVQVAALTEIGEQLRRRVRGDCDAATARDLEDTACDPGPVC